MRLIPWGAFLVWATVLAPQTLASDWLEMGCRSVPDRTSTDRAFAGLASGGDIFKLSKILGHSSVAITQQVYAHLHPNTFAEDYSRVAFAMPEKAGVLLKLEA